MKRARTFQVATREGRYEWPCYDTGVPGLVAHHPMNGASPPYTAGRLWVLAHERSGYGIVYTFRTLAAVIQAARKVRRIDWTKTQKQIRRSKPHIEAAKLLRKEIEEW